MFFPPRIATRCLCGSTRQIRVHASAAATSARRITTALATRLSSGQAQTKLTPMSRAWLRHFVHLISECTAGPDGNRDAKNSYVEQRNMGCCMSFLSIICMGHASMLGFHHRSHHHLQALHHACGTGRLTGNASPT